MIIDHGVKKHKLALLRFPGDIREMMEQDDVKELARSIKEIGLLHPLIIRKVSRGAKEIIAGRHRAAALLRLKRDLVECRLIECTDLEAELISAMENAHRRHNKEERDAYMVRLVDLHLEVQQERANETSVEISKQGHRKGLKVTKQQAYEKIAKTLGIKPESVKHAEYRDKRKKRGGKKAMPGVKTLGMEVNDAFQSGTCAIQQYISDVDWYMRGAVKKIGQMEKASVGFPVGIAERLKDEARSVARLAREFSPTHLCPHCKGLSGYQDRCTACQGHGWVGKGVMDTVLPELVEEGDPCIMVQGRLERVVDILDAEVEEQYEDLADLWGDDEI
jgi:hypothetical protein